MGASLAQAQAPLNDRVLVVYNASVPESHAVANYYMAKRNIPQTNACKIKPDSTEAIDEHDYRSHVQAPIRKCLDSFGRDKILYIIFSYQTPFDLLLDGKVYALDQFVADIWDEFLPFRPATQSDVQPYFGKAQSQGNFYEPYVPLATYRQNAGARHIYSVWRLDAANAALAKGLVDKALDAESHGLSGKGCFDRRFADMSHVADYGYGAGDWDIYRAAQFTRNAGIPVLEDTHEEEFGTPPAPLRCDGAALYAGWYSLNHYNDAFSWDPGAIGIHLDSASAVNPRGGSNWSANALVKGITVTSGAVTEPFLENLPHPDQIFLYLFQGANVGDAMLRGTRLIKWMIINIGDPLYRPFPNGLHARSAGNRDVILALIPQVELGSADSLGVIGLAGSASSGGVTFALKSNRPELATVPPTATLEAGASFVKFPIHTTAVQDDGTTLQISAIAKGTSGSNTLVLYPVLAPLAVANSMKQNSTSQAIIALRRTAPHEGARVTLSTSNPAILTVPAEVNIPAGEASAKILVTAHSVRIPSSVTVAALYAHAAQKATIKVIP